MQQVQRGVEPPGEFQSVGGGLQAGLAEVDRQQHILQLNHEASIQAGGKRDGRLVSHSQATYQQAPGC